MTKDKSIIVRCVSEGYDDTWTALCLDFDIAVQGHSAKEVRDNLNDAIILYLETIHSYPESEQEAFLKRRAPLRVWVKYGLIMCCAFFFNSRSDKKDSLDFFTEHLPCIA